MIIISLYLKLWQCNY